MNDRHAVLTVADMYLADHLASVAGVVPLGLMESAGWAVAHALWTRHKPCQVVVLCGPGNNGGDGFVAARLLERRGYQVRIGLLGDLSSLQGDAAAMAELWKGEVHPLAPALLDKADVVVDALFGAGLSRFISEDVSHVFAHIRARALPVIAVDVPSGVDGNSGAILGDALQAQVTVTFFRKKPGHLLYPGRGLCGEVVVANIGIADATLATISPKLYENHPDLWMQAWPQLSVVGHKYQRGHALLVSGDTMIGAIRMATMAARRAGAGLATIVAYPHALSILRSDSPGTIVAPMEAFDGMLEDPRYSACLIGPGAGIHAQTQERVLTALNRGKRIVLDADALTAFAGSPEILFRECNEDVLMTPHEGEFSKLWGTIEGNKIAKAREAADRSGSVVLLKGADTVIAHPDGRTIINSNAPPFLATAGSGDVLAGIATGLMAQGMPTFEAAAAAVWWHGECARLRGPGLIAEDLIWAMPEVLSSRLIVTKQ